MLKRRVTRQVQRFPVRLSLQELNGQPAGDSFLVDISSLGAQLESSVMVSPYTSVDFVVRFPWMENNTRLAGQVRWIKPLAGNPERFRFGLRFFQPFWEFDTLARQGKLGGELSPDR
jgi:hypothetical protein